ncbi:hypothetical protein PV08_01985 [Exophiala spinifera]|uniref:Uncharacterized protein n=1 Tax=Exophiala spinifera TaxID=91928 RepID=A0A0D2BSK0_9EURO|nr:uncharacterized protein PV08_01985 [Exophiala spinifera]KIW21405.1 hypothetical protein PV08_01985 [Exophiala spinifera]
MSLLRITTSPQTFACGPTGITIARLAHSTAVSSSVKQNPSKPAEPDKSNKPPETPKESHKSMAQADEEMRNIMEGLSGDGGASGAELEDGKPVAMKRSVRENMFRYI